MPKYTPEQIAAAQAAVNSKPDDAELVEATYDASDGSGHRIPRGTLGWRWMGTARFAGPPDANSKMDRNVHWTCRDCGIRYGWEPAPTRDLIEDRVGGKHVYDEDLPATTYVFQGQLEIDAERGVIYFHTTSQAEAERIGSVTVLRICQLPRPVPTDRQIDITHMYGVNYQSSAKCIDGRVEGWDPPCNRPECPVHGAPHG